MLVEFKQNRFVRTIKNFELFDKKREKKKTQTHTKRGFLNHFWQTVDAIMEHVPVTETIDNSPTRETRLKVVPNMADPISLNENSP